jgi:CRISPR-associated protein Cmr6
MTALVRTRMLGGIGTVRAPHASLLLGHGWPEYVEGEGSRGKAGHIDQVCMQQPSALYRLAYQRWCETTQDPSRFRSLFTRIRQRLFIGLSAGNALETGVCASHSYGMPMIPGSSVKGCVQAYARSIGVSAEYRAVLFGEDAESSAETTRLAGAGSLVWHDAWWVPETGSRPFHREVVTVHHQHYYAGMGEATDFDSPVPNAQITVQGGFYFAIEGAPAWAALGRQLLTAALAEIGIGAKRTAGYGTMTEDQAANGRAEAALRSRQEESQSTRERVESRLRDLTEDQLAKRFGTELNSTRNGYTDDEWELVPIVVRELFGELIDAWSEETKRSNKARFKARRFFLGQGGGD